MICPQCQTRVSDDAVICDSCNAILDTTFLGDDITNEESKQSAADATRIKAVEAPRPKSVESDATRVKAIAPNPGKTKADPNATRVKAAPPEAPPARRKAIIEGSFGDDEDVALAGQAARKKLSALVEAAAPPAETAQALDDLVGQFKALPFSERLTAGSALAVLVTLALPWRWTKDDGDIIGLAAGAWPVALMAALVATAVFLRRHPVVRPYKERVLQLVAGLSGFSLLVSVAFWRSWHEEQVLKAGGRLITQVIEDSSFGLFLGVFACVLMLVGAVKSYLDRARLE